MDSSGGYDVGTRSVDACDGYVWRYGIAAKYRAQKRVPLLSTHAANLACRVHTVAVKIGTVQETVGAEYVYLALVRMRRR